ncbi:hypothetical protein ACTFIZ_008242 [Dictyostelium cf. discoideum]
MSKELKIVEKMKEYDSDDDDDDDDDDDSDSDDSDSDSDSDSDGPFNLDRFDPTKSFELSLGKSKDTPKKNKKSTTSDEAFKAKINPYSANLKTIIGQLESDSTTLSDLHKKFSEQLYRLKVEEALLEKLQQDLNNKNNGNDGNTN